MAKSRKYRGSSVKRENLIELYGVSDLLKKIESAGGKVDEAVQQAVDRSLEIVGADMQNFMNAHKFTGKTVSSYEHVMASIKDNKVTAMVGYNAKNGGLPAIFLDVGTPKQKGHFFRYDAVKDNSKRLRKIQQETLNEILRGLM